MMYKNPIIIFSFSSLSYWRPRNHFLQPYSAVTLMQDCKRGSFLLRPLTKKTKTKNYNSVMLGVGVSLDVPGQHEHKAN